MIVTWADRESSHGTIIGHVSFGIFDVKGREMGVILYVRPSDEIYDGEPEVTDKGYSRRKGRPAITCGIQSARNGECFGAGFPIFHEHTTLEDARADALKRAEASYKKVKKVADKNDGIYKTK